MALVAVVTVSLGAWALAARGEPAATCDDAGDRLAGIWDDERKAAIRATLLAPAAPQAAKRWHFVEEKIDAYAQGWMAMRRDVCKAAQEKSLSTEVLELRTHCLDTQLARLQEVTALLGSGDASVTENALDSLRALPRLERCSTVETLEARVPQPADEATRVEVEAIRAEIARADVLRLAGKYTDALAILTPLEQRAIGLGYRPIEAEVLYYLGVVREPLDGPAAADKTLRRAAYAAEAGRHDDISAEAWTYAIIVAARGLSDFERAQEYVERARAAIERMGGDHTLEAQLELNQGILYKDQADHGRALAAFARAAELSADDDELRLAALERTAMVHEDRAQLDEAMAAHEYVLRERVRVLGPDHPDVGHAHTNVASTYMQAGRHAEALEHARRALAIAEESLGPDKLTTAHNRYNVAEMLYFMGDYEESLKQHTLALTAFERIRGPESIEVATALVSQGELLVRIDRAHEAVAITRRALAILEEKVGEKHFETARCLINFGDALREAGEHEESLAIARRGLEVLEAQIGKDTGYSGFGWTGIGRSLLDGGQPNEAIEPLERAIRLYEQHGIDPEQVAVARFALARALWESGRDRKRANELAAAARAVFAAAGPARKLELKRLDAWRQRRK
jgi:tetratricopeptide (TPR) repeat protein